MTGTIKRSTPQSPLRTVERDTLRKARPRSALAAGIAVPEGEITAHRLCGDDRTPWRSASALGASCQSRRPMPTRLNR